MVRTAETVLRILPPPPESRSFRIGFTRSSQCLSLTLAPALGWCCSGLLFAFSTRNVSRDHEFVFDGRFQPVQP